MMYFIAFSYMLFQDLNIIEKQVNSIADKSYFNATLIRDLGKTKTLVYGYGLERNIFILEDAIENNQFSKTKNSNIRMLKKTEEEVFFGDSKNLRIFEYQIQNHKLLSYNVKASVSSMLAIPKSKDWLLIHRNGNVVRTNSIFVPKDTILMGRKKLYDFILSDGLFIYGDKNKGSIEAINIVTKNIKWSIPLKSVDIKIYGITMAAGTDRLKGIHRENNDIIALTAGGTLYRINFLTGEKIKTLERFKGNFNNAGLIPSPTFVDMNSDGFSDIVGGSVDGNIYVINGKTFEILWEFEGEEEIQMPSIFFDYNSDGILDVISLDDYMNLYINNGIDGEILLFKNIYKEGGQSYMSIGLDHKRNRNYLVVSTKRSIKYIFLN